MHHPQGFCCPECQQKILVNYLQLLQTGQVQCPMCGLILTMERQQSAAALALIEQSIGQLQQAEQGFVATSNGMLSSHRGKGTSQPRQARPGRTRR